MLLFAEMKHNTLHYEACASQQCKLFTKAKGLGHRVSLQLAANVIKPLGMNQNFDW